MKTKMIRFALALVLSLTGGACKGRSQQQNDNGDNRSQEQPTPTPVQQQDEACGHRGEYCCHSATPCETGLICGATDGKCTPAPVAEQRPSQSGQTIRVCTGPNGGEPCITVTPGQPQSAPPVVVPIPNQWPTLGGPNNAPMAPTGTSQQHVIGQFISMNAFAEAARPGNSASFCDEGTVDAERNATRRLVDRDYAICKKEVVGTGTNAVEYVFCNPCSRTNGDGSDTVCVRRYAPQNTDGTYPRTTQGNLCAASGVELGVLVMGPQQEWRQKFTTSNLSGGLGIAASRLGNDANNLSCATIPSRQQADAYAYRDSDVRPGMCR